jgi:TM2 domain-containing membrane protein YozV
MGRAQDAHAMAQLPPSQESGQISPDGRWRWDGQRWVPNAPALPMTAAYTVAVGQAGAMMVAPKNPAVSLIVSFFIPGVGSMINGDVGTGVAILLLYIVGWFTVFFLIGVPLAIGAWIWGMVDAYRGAQRWNARHGIIS